MLPHCVLVLGGAGSGKSVFAERLVENAEIPKTYLASARGHDAEMQDRIKLHKNRRAEGWTTLETPLDVAGALAGVAPGHAVLFDCATLWLSNQMHADADIAAETDHLLGAIASCKGSVVTVSNEVGAGIVPEIALARKFRDEQGRLNQRLAAAADLVILVAAGLPLVLKGELPEGAV